ncbi:MAG: glutathione peroxidase [Ilumatobacteraceae bacterium]
MSVHEYEVKRADGGEQSLSEFAGKVMLVVNVASKCGLTPQYEGLEALHRELKDQGLAVVGFPCNQFGAQEPGTDDEIQEFCSVNYDVTFPVFAKIDVNGDDAHPLYQYLRSEAPGTWPDAPGADRLNPFLEANFPQFLGNDSVKWNFTKFLVDRDGNVVKRFEPTIPPEALKDEVAAAL